MVRPVNAPGAGPRHGENGPVGQPPLVPASYLPSLPLALAIARYFETQVEEFFSGAFLLAARRSETVAGLVDRRDERINPVDRDASLLAGAAVLLAVLVMFVVEIAQGQDGSPYAALGALGGVAYVTALVVLRLRR